MRIMDKYENCEFCKHRFHECEKCNPNYIAYDNFELDERAYYDERRIRQDERNKIITLLKSDLENFDGLADDCVERKDIHDLLQNNAVRKYIEETIVLLEKEA